VPLPRRPETSADGVLAEMLAVVVLIEQCPSQSVLRRTLLRTRWLWQFFLPRVAERRPPVMSLKGHLTRSRLSGVLAEAFGIAEAEAKCNLDR